MNIEPDTTPSPAPPARHIRALLVEDNESDRWLYSGLLEARGYSVHAVGTAEEALEAFGADPHQMVVIDHILPGMDGAELCRRIRQRDRGGEPFVLAMTASDTPASLDAFLEAGADDFIRKPVSPAFFAVRLEVAERRLHDRDRRQGMETRLHVSTWELDRVLENLPEVFFSADLTEGRLLKISRAAEPLLGHPTSALLDQPGLWRTVLLPAGGDGPGWDELGTSPPGTRLAREYLARHPDGSASWVRASIALDVEPVSGHLQAFGFLVNITDQRVARVALAQRNRELAALYRVSELTLTADPPEVAYARILEEVAQGLEAPVVLLERLDPAADRLVVQAARGFPLPADAPLAFPLHQTPAGGAVLTGEPLVDTDPQNRRDLVHGALRGLAPRFWASFPLKAGGAVIGTLTVLDQAPRTADSRWTQLGTRVAMYIAAYMERVDAEHALRESEARHRGLAEALTQANRELESFAYSVSHDLRAPLRTMQGFAHALTQQFGNALPAEAQDYLRRIIASGRQSERLIADLLAYSRLSFERLEIKPVALGDLVSQALEQTQADIAESQASVEVTGRLPSVLGNPTALLQVLANLLSNAVKFVPAGRRPEVRIRAEDRGDWVRLWVEDNGIGVPRGQEERIFRVFERLSSATSQPGTGIGLALVRRGMERSGGRCGLEHRPEGGSAFWIEAPKEPRTPNQPWFRLSRRG